MRTTLVTPNWRWDDSPLPMDTLRPPPSPPLEWAYLATHLASELCEVIDAYAADLELSEVLARVIASGVGVVVISSSPNLLYWRCPPFSLGAPAAVADGLRQAGWQGTMIVVGPHGTHSPEWTLKVTTADYVWRGSTDGKLGDCLAEDTLLGCRELYGESSEPGSTSIAIDQAAGLPVAELAVFDHRTYPPHMWLINEAERRQVGELRSGALVESSRGCPWSCGYCAKGPVRDRYGRRRIEDVEHDVVVAKAAGFDYVFFVDETFNIPSDHFDEVLGILRRLDMKFGFQGRPDLIDAEMANALGEAGCVYAELGIDLVGDRLSADLSRRQNLAVAERGVELARESIPIVRHNRLNASTLDYLELFPTARDLDWEIPADPIYPYPGTAIGAALMQRYGYVTFDWEFAEIYSWWLRVEVALQRSRPNLSAAVIKSMRSTFLTSGRPEAAEWARLLAGIEDYEGLHHVNKSILGVGGRPSLRGSGPQ